MRVFAALVTCLALSVVSAHAYAEPTASEREAARTLLLSGRDKRKAGKLKEALADFQRAHAIMHVPTTALDLGKTQQALGLLVEAHVTFLDGANHPESASESNAFKRARQEAQKLANDVAPKLCTLKVTAPTGTTIRLDDAELSAGSMGAPLKVNPGKHEIVASLDSDSKRTSVDLREGETRSVDLKLQRSAPKEPDPAIPANAEPSTTPAPPSTTTPAPEQPKTGTGTSSLVYIGGGVAGLGLVVGTVTGILALNTASDLSGRCEGGVRCPPAAHSDIDSGEAFGTVSTVAFVAALIGGGILVYGLLNSNR